MLKIPNFKDTIPRYQPKDAISCLAREALKIWMKKQSPEEAYQNLFDVLMTHGEKRLAEELRQWVTGIPTEQSKLPPCLYYRQQIKLRKGNLFTSVCQEFCPRRGCLPDTPRENTPMGRHAPRQTHPQADTSPGRHTPRQTPPGQKDIPLGRHPGIDTPWADPQGRPSGKIPLPRADRYCSGWYTSYWNAFLSIFLFQMH